MPDRHAAVPMEVEPSAQPRHPVIGVGGLVFDRGNVLLVKRGSHPAKGYWSIPGGKVAHGESLAEAVEREMLEETGLRVRVGPLVEIYERLPRRGAGGMDGHFVVLDYLCEATGGLLRAGDDAAEAGWFAVSELSELHMTPGALPVVEKGYAMAGGPLPKRSD